MSKHSQFKNSLNSVKCLRDQFDFQDPPLNQENLNNIADLEPPQNTTNQLILKQLDVFQGLQEQRRNINNLISQTHLKLSEKESKMIKLKHKALQSYAKPSQFNTIGTVKHQSSPMHVRQQAQQEVKMLESQQKIGQNFRVQGQSRNQANQLNQVQFNTYNQVSSKLNGIRPLGQNKQLTYNNDEHRQVNRVQTGKSTVNNMPGLKFHTNASENRIKIQTNSNQPYYFQSVTPEYKQYKNSPMQLQIGLQQETPMPKQISKEPKQLQTEPRKNDKKFQVQNHPLPPRYSIQKLFGSEDGLQPEMTMEQMDVMTIEMVEDTPKARPINDQQQQSDLIELRQDHQQFLNNIVESNIERNQMDQSPQTERRQNDMIIQQKTNQMSQSNNSINKYSNQRLIEEIKKRLSFDQDFQQIIASKFNKEGTTQNENQKKLESTLDPSSQNQKRNKEINVIPTSKQLSKELNGIQQVEMLQENQIKFEQESNLYQYDDMENQMPLMNQTIKSSKDQFKLINQKSGLKEQKGNDKNLQSAKNQIKNQKNQINNKMIKEQKKTSTHELINPPQIIDSTRDITKQKMQSQKIQANKMFQKEFNKIFRKSIQDYPEEIREKVHQKVNEKFGHDFIRLDSISQDSLSQDGSVESSALIIIIKQQIEELLRIDSEKSQLPLQENQQVQNTQAQQKLNKIVDKQDSEADQNLSKKLSSEQESNSHEVKSPQKKVMVQVDIHQSLSSRCTSPVCRQTNKSDSEQYSEASRSQLKSITEENFDQSQVNQSKNTINQNIPPFQNSQKTQKMISVSNTPIKTVKSVSSKESTQDKQKIQDEEYTPKGRRSIAQQLGLQKEISINKLGQHQLDQIEENEEKIGVHYKIQDAQGSSTSVFQNPNFVQNCSEINNIFNDASQNNQQSLINQNIEDIDQKNSQSIRISSSEQQLKLPYSNKTSLVANQNIQQIISQGSEKQLDLKDKYSSLVVPSLNKKKNRRSSGAPPNKVFGNLQMGQLEPVNFNFQNVKMGANMIEMPKVTPLKLNLTKKQLTKGDLHSGKGYVSERTMGAKFNQNNNSNTQRKEEEKSYNNFSGSMQTSKRGSILIHKLDQQNFKNIDTKSPSQASKNENQVDNQKDPLISPGNFDSEALQDDNKRRYFIPHQYLDGVKHTKKKKLELRKGMITIKWKKGKESLGIGIGDENPGDVFDDKDKSQCNKLKKEGFGKFQTYANFLKGEEKEQYERYLENKRKKN